MVKIIILAMLMAAAVMATPTERVSKDYELPQEIESNEDWRIRQMKCNVPSFANDSACAAHCLSMDKGGGHCESSFCICQKDTFIEVVDPIVSDESDRELEQGMKDCWDKY